MSRKIAARGPESQSSNARGGVSPHRAESTVRLVAVSTHRTGRSETPTPHGAEHEPNSPTDHSCARHADGAAAHGRAAAGGASLPLEDGYRYGVYSAGVYGVGLYGVGLYSVGVYGGGLYITCSSTTGRR